MAELKFTKFQKADLGLLKKWIIDDHSGKRYLKPYTSDSFLHLINFNSRYLWMIYMENILVGFFDLEIGKNRIGYFSYYVAPAYRGKGVGTQILNEVITLPELKKIDLLEGNVAKSNTISIKILEGLDFKYIHTNNDNMLVYQKVI